MQHETAPLQVRFKATLRSRRGGVLTIVWHPPAPRTLCSSVKR